MDLLIKNFGSDLTDQEMEKLEGLMKMRLEDGQLPKEVLQKTPLKIIVVLEAICLELRASTRPPLTAA